MKVYRVNAEGYHDGPLNLVHYEGTKGDAHEWVKNNVGKAYWPEATITEVDMQTDKAGIVAALTGEPIETVLRTWGITPRGGLKEEK